MVTLVGWLGERRYNTEYMLINQAILRSSRDEQDGQGSGANMEV
jgi:hypothetical protein